MYKSMIRTKIVRYRIKYTYSNDTAMMIQLILSYIISTLRYIRLELYASAFFNTTVVFRTIKNEYFAHASSRAYTHLPIYTFIHIYIYIYIERVRYCNRSVCDMHYKNTCDIFRPRPRHSWPMCPKPRRADPSEFYRK